MTRRFIRAWKRSSPPSSSSVGDAKARKAKPAIEDAVLERIFHGLAARTKTSVQDPSLAPAAVLVLLYSKDGEYCVLLNKRTQEVEHHKGEISFPGGAKDPQDASFLETALRETQEEMGIRPEDVTMLGELDEQVTRTHFNVRVYVGNIPYPYPFVPSSTEIAEVLEAPIRDLLDPANRREELRSEGGVVSRVQSYLYGDHLVFGATARILTQFLELLENGAGVNDGGQ